MRRLSVLLLLALAAYGAAQQYRVDPAGGPLTLSEEVVAAATTWNEAIEAGELPEEVRSEAVLSSEPDASNLITFGDADLMGPDLVSATVTDREEGGLEVWLHPELYREYPRALLHELGHLLGLPSADSGVMAPLLTSTGTADTSLEPEDVALLLAASRSIPGDIDGDGSVGLSDLAELGRSYGRRGVNLPADLDGNGVVDEADLELLRGVYEFRSPASPAVGEAGASQPPAEDGAAQDTSGAGPVEGGNGEPPDSGGEEPGESGGSETDPAVSEQESEPAGDAEPADSDQQ